MAFCLPCEKRGKQKGKHFPENALFPTRKYLMIGQTHKNKKTDNH